MLNNTPKINKLKPVIIGTVVMSLLSLFPVINIINLFFCAGIIIGGFAGVASLNKQVSSYSLPLTYKDGIMTGILSGILSSIIVSGINLLLVLFSKQNPIVEAMKVMADFGLNLPKEIDEQFIKFSEEYNKYGFSPTISLISFFSNIIIFPVFGLIGGSIGVSVFNRKKRIN